MYQPKHLHQFIKLAQEYLTNDRDLENLFIDIREIAVLESYLKMIQRDNPDQKPLEFTDDSVLLCLTIGYFWGLQRNKEVS